MVLEYGVLLATSLSLFASPAMAAEDGGACLTVNVQQAPANVDMERVRAAWLGWYNDYRATLGLSPYADDATLERTAGNWAYYAVKRGTIDHKRAWKAPYYDYRAIESWFADRGARFANVRGKTFTENIGWGVYSCSADDCTDELIASIRTTFDFFMGEKGLAYRPHYNAIVNDAFGAMGLGIGIDPSTKRYYLTAHFATAVAEPAPAFCGA